MRGTRTVARIAVCIPIAALIGCSDQATPTAPSPIAVPSAALAMHGDGSHHAGAIVAHDSCDPASFDAVIGPGTCVKPGRTTFDEFIGELAATQTVRSWRFNPLDATAHRGVDMLAVNVGGEEHTFTPVQQFGGGFIPDLNVLSGNPVPAPECLDFATLVFVEGGEKSVIPGADLAAVADASGIARVECCIHPWMRAEVTVK
jgi:hypothetical protein